MNRSVDNTYCGHKPTNRPKFADFFLESFWIRIEQSRCAAVFIPHSFNARRESIRCLYCTVISGLLAATDRAVAECRCSVHNTHLLILRDSESKRAHDCTL